VHSHAGAWERWQSRHFGRDAEIQAMDGNQMVVQVLDLGNAASCPLIQGQLLYPLDCHPWTLDFGIHVEMTGIQHLRISTSAGVWERWHFLWAKLKKR